MDPLPDPSGAQCRLQELRDELERAQRHVHSQHEKTQRALVDLYRLKAADIVRDQHPVAVLSLAAVSSAAADATRGNAINVTDSAGVDAHRTVLPLSDTDRDELARVDVDIGTQLGQPAAAPGAARSESSQPDNLQAAWEREWNFYYFRVPAHGDSGLQCVTQQRRIPMSLWQNVGLAPPRKCSAPSSCRPSTSGVQQPEYTGVVTSLQSYDVDGVFPDSPAEWELQLKELTASGDLQARAKEYLHRLMGNKCYQPGDTESVDGDADDFFLSAVQADEDTEMGDAASVFPLGESDDPVLPLYNKEEEGYTETDTSVQTGHGDHGGDASDSGESILADATHEQSGTLAERKSQWNKIQTAWLAVLDISGSSKLHDPEALAVKQLCSFFDTDNTKALDYESIPITLNEHLALQRESRLAWVMTVIAGCVRQQAQKVAIKNIQKMDRKAHSIWNKGNRRGGAADTWKETSVQLADRLLKVVDEVARSNWCCRSIKLLRSRCAATEVTLRELLILRRKLDICQLSECPEREPKSTGGKEQAHKQPNGVHDQEDGIEVMADDEASEYESSFIDDTEDAAEDAEVSAGRDIAASHRSLVGQTRVIVGGASSRQTGLGQKRLHAEEAEGQSMKRPCADALENKMGDFASGCSGKLQLNDQMGALDGGTTSGVDEVYVSGDASGSQQQMKGSTRLLPGTKVELSQSPAVWASHYTLVDIHSDRGTADILHVSVSSDIQDEIQSVKACNIRPMPEQSTPTLVPGFLLEVASQDCGHPLAGIEWQLCLVLVANRTADFQHAQPSKPVIPEGSTPLVRHLYKQQCCEHSGPSDGQCYLKLYNLSCQEVVHVREDEFASMKLRQAMRWDPRSGDWTAQDKLSLPGIYKNVWKELDKQRDATVLRRLQAMLRNLQLEGQSKTQSMPALRKVFLRLAAREPSASKYFRVCKLFKANEWPLELGDATNAQHAAAPPHQQKSAGASRGKQKGRSQGLDAPVDIGAERRKAKRDALQTKKAKAAKLKDQGRILAESSQTPVKAPPDGVALFPGMENSPTVLSGLASKLKDYQWDGCRFIWENLVMEHDGLEGRDDDMVGGCILAHSMGLGKTLQTVTFLHTYHVNRPGTQSLIVLPKNVLANWKQEFDTWLESDKGIHVYPVFNTTDVPATVRRWSQRSGGILILTYSKLAILLLAKQNKETTEEREAQNNEVRELLMNTPSVIVADEAHELRTTSSDKHRAIKMIKTKRRLALTGYPLQNNLNEYYVMICWVRPDYLGSPEEFKSEFAEPINEGQTTTDPDARATMLDQLSVLDDFTSNFIHRKGINLLEKELAKINVRRTEHVLLLRLSDAQEKLYDAYLKLVPPGGRSLLRDSEILRKICNTPASFVKLLRDACETASQEASDVCDLTLDEQPRGAAHSGKGRKEPVLSISAPDARKLLDIADEVHELQNPKLNVLDRMLSDSRDSKEQLVIFSESVKVLDSLESHMIESGWTLAPSQPDHQLEDNGTLYYLRLDGSTNSQKRQVDVNRFKKDSKLILVYLMSTKAGSLGINLTSAARLALLDCPWNPVHNAQGVARIFRLGQTRSASIYRLVYENTMEHTIYTCTLGKESLACSVVDRKPTIPQNKEKQMYKYTRPTPLDKTRLMETVSKIGDTLLSSICSSSDSVMNIKNHQALLATDADAQLDTHDRLGAATRYLQRFEPTGDVPGAVQGGQPMMIPEPSFAPLRLIRLRKKRNIGDKLPQIPILVEGNGAASQQGLAQGQAQSVQPTTLAAKLEEAGTSHANMSNIPDVAGRLAGDKQGSDADDVIDLCDSD